MSAYIPVLDIPSLYKGFNVPITREDCGKMCSPHNPTSKPFCCDICQAVPVAYHQEWDYLSTHTDLWHEWLGDECASAPVTPDVIRADTPDHLTLLACKGPDQCQREYRAASCRQFPFFPYVTSEFRFIGLAYYWDFESTCWVISHLDRVTSEYRREFIATYDDLFNRWPNEFESYAAISEEAREFYSGKNRRIALLHRNGGMYVISPASELSQKIDPEKLHRFGPYSE